MSLKITGKLCHDNDEWCKLWRGTDIPVQNWHEEVDKFWPEQSKISEICTLMGCFWPNYIIFDLNRHRGVMFNGIKLKIYRGVMCHENEIWCKNWRGIDLSVQNWHEKFNEFWPEHSKISKICALMGCFWPKYMFELKKSIEEFCLMELKCDIKFEGKLTCAFWNDMKNFENFRLRAEK